MCVRVCRRPAPVEGFGNRTSLGGPQAPSWAIWPPATEPGRAWRLLPRNRSRTGLLLTSLAPGLGGALSSDASLATRDPSGPPRSPAAPVHPLGPSRFLVPGGKQTGG